MPVSGLVLTLGAIDVQRDAALTALRTRPEISLGEPQGRRLPIVVDTQSSDEDKATWEWLHALPGVDFVDLVSADCSGDAPSTPCEGSPR